MIPRTKLQAALSELQDLRAENLTNSCKYISLEGQMTVVREQLAKSEAEKVEMQSAIIKMVPQHQLTDAEARNETLHAQLKNAGREHCLATEQLQQMVATLESEKSKLLFSLQVCSNISDMTFKI
jgi:hypothetical protein